ncbi:MAG: UDP-3-O-(3-hydroxymyristoyl)glucosamine N-acyltransferase [Rickettsiales bacterium]|jgi:UDP-3-O-[3-hydroxymyristoyl] glucosamine N-acyltransferase|nr:UDP-3-O-(3-hydroxymyristoyl)glucosamine N-acyltransferase [Rickettsiales bacterium]
MLKSLLIRLLSPKSTANLTAGAIAETLDLELRGNPLLPVKSLMPIADAMPGSGTFYSTERNSEAGFKILPLDTLKNTRASIILLQPENIEFAPQGATLLITDSPRRDVIKIMELMFPARKRTGIDRTARVRGAVFRDKKSVFIGPNVVVEPGCIIGENVEIESCAYVGGLSTIGRGSRIRPNASVMHTTCGSDCDIQNGACVGKSGFGYSIVAGKNTPIPHLGRVVLGDRVDVGANSCIDRGVMADTIIGDGTKLDNLVQVGHNVKIGKECFLAGQSGFAGGCELGDRVKIGGQSGIVNKANIGDGAEVASFTGVTKNFPAGSKAMGFPAVEGNDFLRMHIFLKNSIKN